MYIAVFPESVYTHANTKNSIKRESMILRFIDGLVGCVIRVLCILFLYRLNKVRYRRYSYFKVYLFSMICNNICFTKKEFFVKLLFISVSILQYLSLITSSDDSRTSLHTVLLLLGYTFFEESVHPDQTRMSIDYIRDNCISCCFFISEASCLCNSESVD